MARDGCDKRARRHGVFISLQILNHRHLRELKVCNDAPALDGELVHRPCASPNGSKDFLRLDAPLPCFPLLAAFLDYSRGVNPHVLGFLQNG